MRSLWPPSLVSHPWVARLQAYRRPLRVLGYLAPLAALTYCMWLLASGWDELAVLDWRVFATLFPLVMLEYLAALLLQLTLWMRLVGIDSSPSWTDVGIFFRAVMMRALPGGPWHWAGRVAMYAGETEIAPAKIVRWTLVETLLMCSTGVGLAGLARPETSPLLRASLLGAALILAAHVSARWQPKRWPPAKRTTETLLWLALGSGAWIAGGAITHALVQVGGARDLTWVTAVYVWTAVGLVGIAVTPLPTSLGLRELLLVWFLAPHMTPALSVVIGVTLRAVFLVADLTWGGLGWAASHLVLRVSGPPLAP